MMSRISVKGNDMHPVYKWLTAKNINGFKVIKPGVKPDDPDILNWLNG